jgi:hypothetical protein
VIKLVTHLAPPLAGQLLTMNLSSLTFRKQRLYREPNCPICSHLGGC